MSENEIAVLQCQPKRDFAFEIIEIDEELGKVIVSINKGILGAMANQLKNTKNYRKAASIIRKLGFELAHSGDILYRDSEQDHESTV